MIVSVASDRRHIEIIRRLIEFANTVLGDDNLSRMIGFGALPTSSGAVVLLIIIS